MSFEIHRNRERKKLELRVGRRKCLHLYHYFLDPRFGLMNARIQTWFPFSVQVCLNGREWLARRMEEAGLDYERHDNCFPWTADFARAQRLMDELLALNWPGFLEGTARRLNPAAKVSYRPRILRAHGLIAKLPNTRRYRITRKGSAISTAAMVS